MILGGPKRDEETLLRLLAAGIAAHTQRPLPPALPRDADLSGALERAAHVQLAGLATTGAAALGFDEQATRHKEVTAAARRASAIFLASANAVSSLLAAADVRHVFFKGVVSDDVFFGGRGLRGTTDIDVLVDDLDRGVEALRHITEGAAVELSRPRLKTLRKTRTLPVRLLGARVMVDMHSTWLMTPLFVDDTPAILSRAFHARGTLPRPALEDYAAYLGGNLVLDRFSGRLKLAVDLAMLALDPRTDWALVVARARRWRVGGALWALARFVERELGVAVPANLESVKPPPWRRALLRASMSGAPIAGAFTRAFEGDSLLRGVRHLVQYVPARALDKLLDER